MKQTIQYNEDTFEFGNRERMPGYKRVSVTVNDELIGYLKFWNKRNGGHRVWEADVALTEIFLDTLPRTNWVKEVQNAIATTYAARVAEREQERIAEEARKQEIRDAAGKKKDQLARWYGPHGWRYGDLIGIEGDKGLFRVQTCKHWVPGFGISDACTTRKLPLTDIEVLDPKVYAPGRAAA